ncbi:MAG: esterase-like activity of phytase family protein [Sphingomonas sp.]|nr:esterase-like activity of phytase family protein [Sphingomonas sp.]
MRTALQVAFAAVAFTLAGPVAAQSVSLSYIGQQTIAPGTTALGTTLGGLSGIDYSPTLDRYITIADDQANARFYTVDFNLTSAAFTGVSFTGVTTLKAPGGAVYATGTIDPEAIRFGANGTIVYTSEGFANNSVQPFIRTANLADGSYVGDYTIPGYYGATGAAGTTGIRNNLAFESLTFGNGGRLVSATENALKQDGPTAGTIDRSPARIIELDPLTGLPGAEFVYLTNAFAVAPTPGNFATNGLVELLGLGGSKYLALERSFTVGAPGTGYDVKLYEIDTAGATNVGGVANLTGVNFTPVTKTLVFDLNSLGIPLDNLEAITFGETLEDGSLSLIIASDDNFNATQFTQFLAFRVSAVPEPSSWALMIVGMGAVGGMMRRKGRAAAFA